MKRIAAILILISFISTTAASQVNPKIESIISEYNAARNDSVKVLILGKLAEYYYIYQLEDLGDSVLQVQLKTAEYLQNKTLILATLFGTAITNISNWRSKETFDKALSFTQKSLEYAKAIGSEEYITLAYIRMASLYRKRGQLENSFNHANIAFTSSLNIKSDSIKILAALEMGDAYLAKGDALLAFKTYINAYDKAADIQYISLLSEVLHRYSNLYQSLENNILAKENLFQSLKLNKENNYSKGIVNDYIDLARITNERSYIEKAINLADSLNLEKYLIRAKNIMYGYYTFIIANSDSTIHYINRNPDLKQFFLNGGNASYNWKLGSIFHYSNQPDSAIHYLKLSEPLFDRDYDIATRKAFYGEMGECYSMLNQHSLAIIYYEKALKLTEQFKDLSKAVLYTNSLSKLYGKLNNYKMAFVHSQKAAELKDTLQQLSNLRDITLIEISNEKKNHEKELELLTEKKLVKRNLQYMAITVALAIIFILLILIGMLPISKLTIKILGYFAFISLFEFIVLLVEPFFHNIAHGEPLKIWLLKITLIAILVPMQHYLESGMMKFIESRKISKLREKFLLKKRGKTKMPAPDIIDEIEKDTAVL